MSYRYPFIPDMESVAAMSDSGVATPLSDEQIRQIARTLDSTFMLPVEQAEYIRALKHSLYRLVIDRFASLEGSARTPELHFLSPLSDEEVHAIAAKPLRLRSVDELRSLKIVAIAMNPVAIEQIASELSNSEDRNGDWDEVFEEETQRLLRRDGITATDFSDMSSLRASIPELDRLLGAEEEAAIANEEFEESFRGSDALEAAEIKLAIKILLDELSEASVQGRDNIEAAVGLIEVRIAGNRLSILTGGFLYVEQGCTLNLAWTNEAGELNGTPESSSDTASTSAQVTVRDTDRAITLVGERDWRPGQRLLYSFSRSGERPYTVTGRASLELPPSQH